MTNPHPSASAPPASLLRAVRRMLRPLVRLLMKNGITYPVLTDVLRELFVDVAVNDLLTDPKSRTDSRVSVLSGVHRKEIRRLRESDVEADATPEIVTRNSQIIARWLALHAASAGQAQPLPRSAPAGDASFDALIASVTTDIRPRAILDDWISQGIVTVSDDDHVHLNIAAFIPRPGGEEQLFYFSRNLHDHIAAAAANIGATGAPPFIDRSVHYDRLSPAMARRLESSARAISTRAIMDINRLASELVDSEADVTGDDPLACRVNVGVYIYAENEAAPRRPDAKATRVLPGPG